jgi:hypothetical protein
LHGTKEIGEIRLSGEMRERNREGKKREGDEERSGKKGRK